MKEKLIQLLQELIENKIIEPELQIIYTNGKEKQLHIDKLVTSNINRRIQYFKFNEIIKNKNS